MGVVPAGAYEAGHDLVSFGKPAETGKGLLLAHGVGQVERGSVPDRFRDDGVDEVVQRGGTDNGEHPVDRNLVWTEVASMERHVIQELLQGRAGFGRARHLCGVHSG